MLSSRKVSSVSVLFAAGDLLGRIPASFVRIASHHAHQCCWALFQQDFGSSIPNCFNSSDLGLAISLSPSGLGTSSKPSHPSVINFTFQASKPNIQTCNLKPRPKLLSLLRLQIPNLLITRNSQPVVLVAHAFFSRRSAGTRRLRVNCFEHGCYCCVNGRC